MNSSERMALAMLAVLISSSAFTQEAEVDSVTGFTKTGDWELVRANCIACHSAKLITQQRGTAAQWLTMIRWMQAKQNLWQFDPAVEKKIVTYLADNYAPQADRRRAAIPPDMMPPNPYAPDSSLANE